MILRAPKFGSESELGLALIGQAHKQIHGAGRGLASHPAELDCKKNQPPIFVGRIESEMEACFFSPR